MRAEFLKFVDAGNHEVIVNLDNVVIVGRIAEAPVQALDGMMTVPDVGPKRTVITCAEFGPKGQITRIIGRDDSPWVWEFFDRMAFNREGWEKMKAGAIAASEADQAARAAAKAAMAIENHPDTKEVER